MSTCMFVHGCFSCSRPCCTGADTREPVLTSSLPRPARVPFVDYCDVAAWPALPGCAANIAACCAAPAEFDFCAELTLDAAINCAASSSSAAAFPETDSNVSIYTTASTATTTTTTNSSANEDEEVNAGDDLESQLSAPVVARPPMVSRRGAFKSGRERTFAEVLRFCRPAGWPASRPAPPIVTVENSRGRRSNFGRPRNCAAPANVPTRYPFDAASPRSVVVSSFDPLAEPMPPLPRHFDEQYLPSQDCWLAWNCNSQASVRCAVAATAEKPAYTKRAEIFTIRLSLLQGRNEPKRANPRLMGCWEESRTDASRGAAKRHREAMHADDSLRRTREPLRWNKMRCGGRTPAEARFVRAKLDAIEEKYKF